MIFSAVSSEGADASHGSQIGFDNAARDRVCAEVTKLLGRVPNGALSAVFAGVQSEAAEASEAGDVELDDDGGVCTERTEIGEAVGNVVETSAELIFSCAAVDDAETGEGCEIEFHQSAE